MKTAGLIFSLLSLGVIGVGCSRQTETARRPVGLNYWELPGSAVVVKVNEFQLTKAENERRIEMRMALAQAKGKKLNARQKRDFRARLLKSSEFSYVQDVLTSSWGKTNSVFFTENERLEGRRSFAKSLTRGRVGYDDLRERFEGLSPEYVDQFVDFSTYNLKCRNELGKLNESPIATNEVSNRRRVFVDYNKRVAATNAVVWAAASNLWKRVRKDPAAFDAEIARYQENEAAHISSDPDMGEVSLSFFDDDPVWKDRLLKAKEGDILPPRIGDNGLLMVKILKCIPLSAQENGREPRWRLAKMFWELGAEWEPQTDDQILADLKSIHHREGLKRGFAKLFESAQISYPSGTNLLKRVRSNKNKRNLLPNDDRIPYSVRRKIEQGE